MSDTSAADQQYLSIGDALDILKPEFPEITISKIRFFEGQGLIEPERTPSGFRKFTTQDLERLRWVLRQQQEAYLPLRVLRERLEAAEASGIVPRKPLRQVERSAPADEGDDDRAPADPEQEALDATPESLGEFRHPAARARSAGLRPGSTPAPRSPAHTSSASSASPAAGGGAATGTGDDLASAPVTPDPLLEAPERLGSRNPMLGAAGGGAMAFHDLAAASGLSLDDLRQLEEFGLITGRQMFDGRYYGEDALAVARSVVAFRVFGVEPRHLRMYKASADREAAFFAQVLSPSLHRRGEEAKTKVAGTLIELRRLGEQIREVVLGQALRDLTDGRS